MKSFIAGIKLVFAAAAVVFCGACSEDLLHLEPMQQSDITVKELLKRMEKATDPKHNYRNCKSYMMKQTLSVIQGNSKDLLTSEIRFLAPDKMRITTLRDGKPFAIEIYNAGKGWSIDPATRRVTKKEPGFQTELMRIFTQMATPSLDATQIFRNVSIDMYYEGNKKMYRLICDAGVEGIAPYVQYIDGQTYLQVRMETIMYINGLEFLYITYPTDYTWYQDIRLPLTSTISLMDTTRVSKMVDFQLNPYFPVSNFLPPRQPKIKKEFRPIKKLVKKIQAKRQARAEKKAAEKAKQAKDPKK